MNRKTERQFGKGAIEIIEEAVHILRLLPPNLFAGYYLGSLPFILGFLYFWADMGRNPFAYKYVVETAFAVALLFIWMKCWHAVFASRLKAHICNKPKPRWTLQRILSLIMVQSAIQPAGLFILPMAALLVFPFGWVYAFYQNVSFFGNGKTDDIKSVYKKSWQYAVLFQRQNHILLFILSIFGFFVFLNLSIVIYIAPQLLNTLFGIETALSKAGWSMLNTTFLAATCGIVYLLMDPLVKIIYVLRCFYEESLYTGEDLKVELKKFQPANKTVLTFLIISLFMQIINPAKAAAVSGSQFREPVVSAQEIDRSIDEVFASREYIWKMPREKPDKSEDEGMLTAFINGVIDSLSNWFTHIKSWVKKIIEWIIKYLNKLFKVDESRKPINTEWMKSVNILLYILLCLVAAVLSLIIWRAWKNRKDRRVASAIDVDSHIPDIADDSVAADELPANTWLNLARELMEQGNLRFALRALYLASLSHLSQHEMITIARFKSNRDYERELNKKSYAMPDLLSAFAQNMRIFENIWYGMHEVTSDIIRQFNENQERIMTFAEK
jgi:hypothetical protein